MRSPTFAEVESGLPDMSVSQAECETYGVKRLRVTYDGSLADDNKPHGCFRDSRFIKYNTAKSSIKCSKQLKCIQKPRSVYVAMSFGTELTSTHSSYVNEQECLQSDSDLRRYLLLLSFFVGQLSEY